MIPSLLTHLQNQTTGFAKIDHARELQPSDISPENTPTLVVYKGKSTSSESRSSPKVSQQNTRYISLTLICDYRFEDDLENQLFDAIIGWQSDLTWCPLEHVEDELVSISGHVIWREYQFQAKRKIKQK